MKKNNSLGSGVLIVSPQVKEPRTRVKVQIAEIKKQSPFRVLAKQYHMVAGLCCVVERQPQNALKCCIIMQQGKTDWKQKYEQLVGWCNGCETYKHAEIDRDAKEHGKLHILLFDPTKTDAWGNSLFLWGGDVQNFAWMMLTGKYEVKLPYYILNEQLDKYRFFEKAQIALEAMKERGRGIADMFTKHGCPSCGTKDHEHLEGDGESEGDGCAGDWAIWNHWSYCCINEECEGWGIHGSYVERSGGW